MNQEIMCWNDSSDISGTICKSFAPRSRQITMPAPPHHSNFYRLDSLPNAQPTVAKHWRHEGYPKYLVIWVLQQTAAHYSNESNTKPSCGRECMGISVT